MIFSTLLSFQASADVNEHFICFTCVDGKFYLAFLSIKIHAKAFYFLK